MTRKSKIARLPRPIRDELNRRLDNGHPGVRLVEWLNSLPEAKEILAREFQRRRITPQNLSEWKRGGYQDWLAQREHAASLQDFLADAKELGDAASPEKLTEAIFNFGLVHYAASMKRYAYRPEHHNKLNHASQMLNDVICLRNCDLARERFDLDTQKLAFNAEKLEIQTQLAHLRLELDRQRLDLARQKAGATTVGQASRLSPSSSPALAADEHIKTNRAESPSAVPQNTRHATRDTEKPASGSLGPGPISPAKTPLEINTLQPNPARSNHPFFIFPQTTTVGQASRLSPSSSPPLATDDHIKTNHPQSPQAISGNTEYGLSRGIPPRWEKVEPNTLWLQFSNEGSNFTPRLAPSLQPQFSQPLSPET